MFRADFNATFSHLNRNALWPYLTPGKRAHDIHSVKTECQLKKLMLVSHLFSSCRAIWTRWQDKVQGFEYKEGLLTFLSAPLQLFQNCAHMPLILEGSIRKKKKSGWDILPLLICFYSCRTMKNGHRLPTPASLPWGHRKPCLMGQSSKLAQLQNNVSCNGALIFPVNSLVPLLQYYSLLPAPFCKWNLPFENHHMNMSTGHEIFSL